MAQKQRETTVQLKIDINLEEEKRWEKYMDQQKFKSVRHAFVHLLQLAENQGPMGEIGEEKEDGLELAEKEEVAKKGAAKGRRGKKATEDVVPEEAKNGDDSSGGEETTPKKQGAKKRVPAKKAAPKKGKQDAVPVANVTPVKHDVTYNVDEAAAQDAEVVHEQAKKGGKGKKGATNAIAELPESGGEGDAVEMEKAKSPKPAAKADSGDAVETKKRRGKGGAAAAAASADDNNDQEPAATTGTRRGMRKLNSASSVVDAMQEENGEQQEEQVTNGDAKKSTKRKPTKAAKEQEDGAAGEKPESSGTATKPKRGRAAKNKKPAYADAETSE